VLLLKGNNRVWNVKYHSKIVGIHVALLNNGKIILFSYPSKERHGSHNGDDEEEHPHSIFGSASHYGIYEIIDVENWRGEKTKRIYFVMVIVFR
jgi:hypothetical protein